MLEDNETKIKSYKMISMNVAFEQMRLQYSIPFSILGCPLSIGRDEGAVENLHDNLGCVDVVASDLLIFLRLRLHVHVARTLGLLLRSQSHARVIHRSSIARPPARCVAHRIAVGKVGFYVEAESTVQQVAAEDV